MDHELTAALRARRARRAGARALRGAPPRLRALPRRAGGVARGRGRARLRGRGAAAAGPAPRPDPRRGARRALERRPAPAAGRRSPTSRRGVAAAAAAIAIGLGIWDASLADDLDTRAGRDGAARRPERAAVSLDGADGRLVVSPDGTGRARRLARARAEREDVRGVGDPRRRGRRRAGAVRVRGRARRAACSTSRSPTGETVAVTLERDGGVDAPTGEPLLTATLS